MKNDGIFIIALIALLAWLGYDYYKKNSGQGISEMVPYTDAGMGTIAVPDTYSSGSGLFTSDVVGSAPLVQTQDSILNWQIPYVQPTFRPTVSTIGDLPIKAY